MGRMKSRGDSSRVVLQVGQLYGGKNKRKQYKNDKANEGDYKTDLVHGVDGKEMQAKHGKEESRGMVWGVEPMGSKYLEWAPSGLRIDILSKGSLLCLQMWME